MVCACMLVTPDMHLVHHSDRSPKRQKRHNYGFALTIWDRLFGTYAARINHAQIGRDSLCKTGRPASLLVEYETAVICRTMNL